MNNLQEEEMKKVMKDAIKEWLNERILLFGKFTLASLSAAILAAMLYIILKTSGWSFNPNMANPIGVK